MTMPIRLRRPARLLLWFTAASILAAGTLIISDGLYRKTCGDPNLQGVVVQIPEERMEFEQASGDVLLLDVIREPNGPDYVLRRENGHVHPYQEERFEIVEGRARFLIGDRDLVLEPGDVGVVPANTVHHWMALDGRPVHVKGQFDPALDTGAWFLNFHGHLERGDMDLLRAAVISSEYRQGTPLPADPSPMVWRTLIRLLAPVGRLLGYKACDQTAIDVSPNNGGTHHVPSPTP